MQLSASYAGLEQWAKSADDAKECIRLDPSFLKGYYRLAVALIELKDMEMASAAIRQGLQLDPNNSQLSKLLRIIKKPQNAPSVPRPSTTNTDRLAKLDEATAKELEELHQQYSQANRELSSAHASLGILERESRIAEITKEELEPTPAVVKCYRSIGKTFLRTTKERAIEHLDKQIEECNKKTTDAKQKIEYLERRIKSTAQNIEELRKPAASE